ncbi:chromosomal replication initiator protein DnaA [candidate division KSB1 bacterium]|nr:chromosomal replication initiator protein DnaA [candidate division KSB1 bacterium]
MVQDYDAMWAKCLELIQPKISTQTFITWFKPIQPVKLELKILTLQLPSQFFFEFLDGHYGNLIGQTLTIVMGENAGVKFLIKNSHPEEMKEEPVQLQPIKKVRGDNGFDSQLNERYNFTNFVEGNCNQFARAAAIAVAEAPGETTFNPLVVYGGVGLGKTHLIQAIGNYAKSEGIVNRVLYVSSEKFTIEFIESIQKNKTTEFSNIYRNVDILLVDDIHFFIDKERTQEEFFHTFNALHQKGKQIVLSSDRPPKELKGMEERLISRFQWGLVVDIHPPELETRIAILQKKSEENGIDIPFEVINYVASNVTSNIRELEGTLIRLLARSSLQGEDITLDLAKNVLKDLGLSKKKTYTIETIQKIVCDHYSIPDDMVRAKSRKKEIAIARQVAMFMVKRFTGYSLKTIGLHFGGRDHSTVIHAINTINDLVQNDVTTQETIAQLHRKIELFNP